MTPQEQRNKRFDDRIANLNDEEVYSDAGWGCMECGGGLKEEFVKSHITSEVHITIEQVERWASGQASGEDGGQDEMVNLAQLLSFLTTLKK